MLTLDGKYHNNMIKTLKKHDVSNLKPQILSNILIPVRIVAHPNKIKVRPVGCIYCINNIQNLILVDISVEKLP